MDDFQGFPLQVVENEVHHQPSIGEPTFMHARVIYLVSMLLNRITTMVTSNADVLPGWIQEVLQINNRDVDGSCMIVGFDSFLIPAEGEGVSRLGAFSITVGNRSILFQISRCVDHFPDLAERFLRNQKHLFLGVDMKAKANQLLHDYGLGFGMKRSDIASLAALSLKDNDSYSVQNMTATLKELCMIVLNWDLRPQMNVGADWGAEVLEPPQVLLATTNSFLCWKIGKMLEADKVRLLGRNTGR